MHPTILVPLQCNSCNTMKFGGGGASQNLHLHLKGRSDFEELLNMHKYYRAEVKVHWHHTILSHWHHSQRPKVKFRLMHLKYMWTFPVIILHTLHTLLIWFESMNSSYITHESLSCPVTTWTTNVKKKCQCSFNTQRKIYTLQNLPCERSSVTNNVEHTWSSGKNL